MPPPVAHPRIPRGLTSNPDLRFEDAVLACMRDPAVLLRGPGGNVVVAGTMERWSLALVRTRVQRVWDDAGTRLRTVADPARRSALLRQRRAALAEQVEWMTLQREPLTVSLSGLPRGMPVEAGAVALWWRHQRQGGQGAEAAWCLLGLILPPESLRYFEVEADGALRSRVCEVVFTS